MEASKDALHAALKQHVPGKSEFYNVYLNRGMKVLGWTSDIPDVNLARSKRKRAFTLFNDAYWSVTFKRGRPVALAEHRSGFKYWFRKA